MDVDGDDRVEAQQPADDAAVNGAGASASVAGADLQLDQHVLPVPYLEAEKVNKSAFVSARVITITEVGHFLADFKQSAVSKGSFVHNDVDQVYDYCTTFAPRRTEASERIVRQRAAAAIRHPYYWGLVMNLSPETPDELVHLVPELDGHSDVLRMHLSSHHKHPSNPDTSTNARSILQQELPPRRSPATSPFEDEDAIRALIEEMEAHRTGDI